MDDKNKNVITEDKCLEITYILPDFWVFVDCSFSITLHNIINVSSIIDMAFIACIIPI